MGGVLTIRWRDVNHSQGFIIGICVLSYINKRKDLKFDMCVRFTMILYQSCCTYSYIDFLSYNFALKLFRLPIK